MTRRMTTCKTCGAEIAKSAKVCPYCGANLVFRKPGVWIGLIFWCAALFCMFKACSAIRAENSDIGNYATDNSPTNSTFAEVGPSIDSTIEPVTESAEEKQGIILGPGEYTVGVDIEAGTYNCLADSGFGVLRVEIASAGEADFVQTMGNVSSSIGEDTVSVNAASSYNNLLLQDGDVIFIEMSLYVEFIPKQPN